MWSVDIDVGGTLTDGFFSDGSRVLCVKVDTTPHDLTVCLFDCLAEGAARAGMRGTDEFLDQIELIRWSTTITSNVLAEMRGPRIGLLVSRGHEQDLYGTTPRSMALDRFLADTDVIGLTESAAESEIMNAARSLLERGVRRICVSLKGSHADSEQEISVKRTIERQYPDHFLGSVPVLAGSDISCSRDDQTRTHCALINAYTHGALAATLFKAEDELRDAFNYDRPFLVSHVNGGVAGISKTKALDTIESGPVLGVHASAHLAGLYRLENIVAMDIGGTTAKVSLLRNGAPVYRKPSDFFGIEVDAFLPDLRSIPLGGGSVATPSSESRNPAVKLGPESMGSYPGPASYALGGEKATLTDAFVAAGLINPDFFLGGSRTINRDLAVRAIEETVAKPLSISMEKACKMMIGRAFELVAGLIGGSRPGLKQTLASFTLFAYGGNGGLFACGVAERAGLDRVKVFSLGPVLSAFGSSVSDISHLYERAVFSPASSDHLSGHLRALVDEVKAESIRDLLGEGVLPDRLSYSIDIEVTSGATGYTPVKCLESDFVGAEELRASLASGLGLDGSLPPDLSIELLRLRVVKEMPKLSLLGHSLQGPDSSHARVGARQVLWGSRTGEAETYRWEDLRPGNRVEGCAVLEGVNTTYFIPEGWVLKIDEFGNGDIEQR